MGQECAAGADAFVDGAGEIALATVEVCERESQVAQGFVAHLAVGGFGFRPTHEGFAVGGEVLFQLCSRLLFFENGLAFAADVEVHQGQLYLGQVLLLAQQPAVDAQLRPMEGTVVFRHAVEVAPVGFEFLQTV